MYIVFLRLQQFGLRLKLTKCHFLEKEVEDLGHVINREGLPKKVDGIARAPAPKNPTELRAFLGSIQYHSKVCLQTEWVTIWITPPFISG